MRATCFLLAILTLTLLGCPDTPPAKDGKAKSGSEPPTIIIGPKLEATGAKFGDWSVGILLIESVVELPLDATVGLKKDQVTAKMKGKGGLVVANGTTSHEAIAPGQKTRFWIHPATGTLRDIAEVTLDLP